MTDRRTAGRSASRRDAAPDTGPAGRPVLPSVQATATPLILSVEQLQHALRTGVVPPGYEHDLFAFLDETGTATLADLILGRVGSYAQFAALADRVLPEHHDTRTWLNERLACEAVARSGELALLDLILPALDHVFPSHGRAGVPDWTLGGGLALALQLEHRISRDVVVSIHGTKLKAFTPRMNPAMARLNSYIEWTGHHLKYDHDGASITFVSAPLQTEPGYEWQTIQGRAMATHTPVEVVVDAIRCRSERFTAQDAFDVAALDAADPRLDQVLAAEVPDALPRLAESLRALEARGTGVLRVSVVPTGTGAYPLADTFDRAKQVVSRAASLAGLAMDGSPPGATRRRPWQQGDADQPPRRGGQR